jgi:hypothetical protein
MKRILSLSLSLVQPKSRVHTTMKCVVIGILLTPKKYVSDPPLCPSTVHEETDS